jgi:hypothetical protein
MECLLREKFHHSGFMLNIPHDYFLYFYVRMVIACPAGGMFSILNRRIRAPVEAGKTLLTMMLPCRQPFIHGNIADRAYVFAYAASVAV